MCAATGKLASHVENRSKRPKAATALRTPRSAQSPTKTKNTGEAGGGVEIGYHDRCIGYCLFASIAVKDHGLIALCVVLYTSLARTSLLRKLMSAIVVKQELRKNIRDATRMPGTPKMSNPKLPTENPLTTIL